MAKFKNVSGEDLISGPLNGRLVLDGEVVEVSADLAAQYAWVAPFWEPVKESKPKSGAADDQSVEG